MNIIMQLQHTVAAMATGDQNRPSVTTTMKDEIGTCSGDATKKKTKLKILPESKADCGKSIANGCN